jgi:hypothetical protein
MNENQPIPNIQMAVILAGGVMWTSGLRHLIFLDEPFKVRGHSIGVGI